MYVNPKIIALVVLATLGLSIALNSAIVAEDGCDKVKGTFQESTWGLAIGVLCLWILGICLISFKTGLGFRFQKIFQTSGEYILLTGIGSVIIPAMILSGSDKDTHSGEIDSTMNNMAVIGLVLSVWVILSTLADVMFDKKLYNMVTKQLGIKR